MTNRTRIILVEIKFRPEVFDSLDIKQSFTKTHLFQTENLYEEQIRKGIYERLIDIYGIIELNQSNVSSPESLNLIISETII